MSRMVAAAAVAVALAAALVANVSAAPPQATDLDCGSAGTMTVLVNGSGQFTPGRIVGGGVLIPVGFQNQHGTFTDNEGNVFEEFPPDVVKGNGKPGKNKDLIVCDVAGSFEDENGSGTFSGTVTGYIVGH